MLYFISQQIFFTKLINVNNMSFIFNKLPNSNGKKINTMLINLCRATCPHTDLVPKNLIRKF